LAALCATRSRASCFVSSNSPIRTLPSPSAVGGEARYYRWTPAEHHQPLPPDFRPRACACSGHRGRRTTPAGRERWDLPAALAAVALWDV
jgi:hypothetical protein